MYMDKNLSFDEFSKTGLDEWEKKAIHDLKGKSLQDLCYTSSDESKVSSYSSFENSEKKFTAVHSAAVPSASITAFPHYSCDGTLTSVKAAISPMLERFRLD